MTNQLIFLLAVKLEQVSLYYKEMTMDLVKEVVIFKDETIDQIAREAKLAADKAQSDWLAEHGDTPYCGFAWVDVTVPRTNSKEAKALEKMGFTKSYRPKRMDLWKPGSYNGQSMDVHEAGARAYAEVLRQYGFRAYMGSRAD